MTDRTPAKFVRQYADLGSLITGAISDFARDVRSGDFPSAAESYDNPEDLLN
jgi:3-methyl-2-oxobutanoate hydroxymethyltransferase